MHDSVDLVGGIEHSTARLRAEAVAMLNEQAALCSPPTAPDATAAAAPQAAPEPRPASPRPDPRPLRLPAADTAALLRELRALGEDEPLQVAPGEPAAPEEPVPVRVRRGAFRRSRGS